MLRLYKTFNLYTKYFYAFTILFNISRSRIIVLFRCVYYLLSSIWFSSNIILEISLENLSSVFNGDFIHLPAFGFSSLLLWAVLWLLYCILCHWNHLVCSVAVVAHDYLRLFLGGERGGGFDGTRYTLNCIRRWLHYDLVKLILFKLHKTHKIALLFFFVFTYIFQVN